MLTPHDIARHWPYVRRNLLIDRLPATSLALEALADALDRNQGGPVSMAPRALRARGLPLTAGRAGHVRTVLRDLERRGVLTRYPARGNRPTLWAFSPHPSRWRLPWRISAASVERVLTGCHCRGLSTTVARHPGSGLVTTSASEVFELPASDHQGGYFQLPASLSHPGATVPNPGPADLGSVVHNPRQTAPAPAPLCNSPEDGTTTSSSLGDPIDNRTLDEQRHDDDVAIDLNRAISQATGDRVFGDPVDYLREAIRILGDDPELVAALAADLGAQTHVRSPVHLAAQAPDRARIIMGEQHKQRRDDDARARLRFRELAQVAAMDGLTSDEADEYGQLRARFGTLGDDAD